jgi:hypothetical protein
MQSTLPVEGHNLGQSLTTGLLLREHADRQRLERNECGDHGARSATRGAPERPATVKPQARRPLGARLGLEREARSEHLPPTADGPAA